MNKSYNEHLSEDEMFFLYSNLQNGEISLLFSTKKLLFNLISQNQYEKSFIHIDGTYKLIDLGLPVMIISTETKEHKFRPICFFVTFSEKKEQINLMLKELNKFMFEKFNYNFSPEYVLSDNCDAIIAACRDSIPNSFVHLLCHFHIMKGVRQKLQKIHLQNHKPVVYMGLKMLKNSSTEQIFSHHWKIVQDFWKARGVCNKFISSFEKENIKKKVSWHYGTSFFGKSRSNNSLESGNKLLKDHFDRKPHNIKDFLVKIQDFLREYSKQENTTFIAESTIGKKIKKAAESIVQNEKVLFFEYEGKENFLYYPRKDMQQNSERQLINSLHNFIENLDHMPKDMNEHYETKQYFRTINLTEKTCDCSNFYKYAYCKHIISFKIFDGELADPEVKARRKPGRKAKATTALKR